MTRDDTAYLKHMLDAIRLIEEYITDMSRDRFLTTRMVQDAVIREFEILGEATKNLSNNFKETHLEIPWKIIAGMRDKLIHGYFGVDLDAVWDTARKDLGPLEKMLEKLI